jgi:hypothetical protein
MATNYGFLEMVSGHYKEIKQCFILNTNKLKIEFDEDVFHDTIIKCGEIYKDDTNDYKKVKAYLWVSYKTNVLNKLERTKRMECFEELTDFDIIDEEYIPEMDEMMDIVRYELYQEFDAEIVNLWFKHIVENKEYKELEEESGIHNIHYQFKRIRKFIRYEMPLKNKRFKEIMDIFDMKFS